MKTFEIFEAVFLAILVSYTCIVVSLFYGVLGILFISDFILLLIIILELSERRRKNGKKN